MKKVRRERISAMLVLALMRILSRHADGRSWTVAQDGSGVSSPSCPRGTSHGAC